MNNNEKVAEGFEIQDEITDRAKALKLQKPDPIETTLPEYARPKYLKIASTAVRELLVNGLQKTVRWENDDSGRIVNPEFKENNLDHVLELLNWMNEIEFHFPKLWKEVCGDNLERWMDLMSMIITHDIGEIIVGDMARGHSDFHGKAGKKHKKKEALMAGLLIDKYLSPEDADRVKVLYREFERRMPGQKLLMMGHILDKGQASQNVAKNIVPFNIHVEGTDAHLDVGRSMTTTLKYAHSLAENLSPAARKELKTFLEERVVKHFEAVEHPDVPSICNEVRAKFPLVLGKI